MSKCLVDISAKVQIFEYTVVAYFIRLDNFPCLTNKQDKCTR